MPNAAPKLSLAMIARDRERELKHALESIAAHVDEIVVVLAGPSQDRTAEVAAEFGAKVIPFLPEEHPEAFYLDTEERFKSSGIPGPFTGRLALADFSAPRNLSFAHCTNDFIFWMDSDDTVRNPEKLRDILATVIEKNLESAFLEYEYDHDEGGGCVVRQIRERILRRSDFENGKIKWHYPIHECIMGMRRGGLFRETVIVHNSKPLSTEFVESKDLMVRVPHRDQIAFRNLKNLFVESERVEKAGEKLDPRLQYYLGSEMRPVDPDRAEKHLDEYVQASGWPEERSQALYMIGHMAEMRGQMAKAWAYFSGSALEFEANPAAWFGLARAAFLRGEAKEAARLCEQGYRQVDEEKAGKPALSTNPYEWQYRSHIIYSAALGELGRWEESLASCEKGLAANPDCKILTKQKTTCLGKLGRKAA